MDIKWTDKKVPITALLDGTVKGQPWPVSVTQGNLHFFDGGTEDDNLFCIPVNGDDTVCPADSGGVDFYCLDTEIVTVCRTVAALLRALIASDKAEDKAYADMGRPDLVKNRTNLNAAPRLVTFDERVRELEILGATTSDAQSVAEVELTDNPVGSHRMFLVYEAAPISADLSASGATGEGKDS